MVRKSGGVNMKLDKTISSHKLLRELFFVRVKASFNTTTAENMAFPAVAAIASGVICRNFSGGIHWLEITAMAVMLLSWVFSGLLSGFLKRWHFIIFSTAFNLLPYLFFNAAETNPSDVNRIFVAVSEFTAVYAVEPLINLGIKAFTISAFIAGITGVCMLIGFFIRKNARSSREYCKVRLNMLSKGTEN